MKLKMKENVKKIIKEKPFFLRYVKEKHDRYTLIAMGIDHFYKNVILNNGEKIKINFIDNESGEWHIQNVNNYIPLSNGINIFCIYN